MFYCEPCRLKYKWPESVSGSLGRCEKCGANGVCNDTPSSELPLCKPVITSRVIDEVLVSIASQMEDLEVQERTILEESGWVYTCDTPGSLWLYQKTLPDGRVVLCNASTALHIELTIAPEDPEDVQEEYEEDE